METTTKETLERLKSQTIEKYGKTIQGLLNSGMDPGRITDIIHKRIEGSCKNFYSQPTRVNYQGIVAQITGHGNGSKSEMVFYEILKENNIPFQFQYPIGPYIVDYLVKDFLALELDGPLHEKEGQKAHDKRKDKYLNRMGYKVLRIPLLLLNIDQKAVIEGIKELIQ